MWWLYDDGGLTLLVPWLLRSHKYWTGCTLRIFTVAVGNYDPKVRLNRARPRRLHGYGHVTPCPPVAQPRPSLSRAWGSPLALLPQTLLDISKLTRKMRIQAETDVVFMDVDDMGRPSPSRESLDRHASLHPMVRRPGLGRPLHPPAPRAIDRS